SSKRSSKGHVCVSHLGSGRGPLALARPATHDFRFVRSITIRISEGVGFEKGRAPAPTSLKRLGGGGPCASSSAASSSPWMASCRLPADQPRTGPKALLSAAGR